MAYYINASFKRFTTADLGIEEVENFRKVWAPNGTPPAEGEVFRNPALARTLSLIATGGRDAFYKGEIAETIERYFKRIGGWMTQADLAAHTSEWTQPIVSNYRGVDVYGLAPNTQGLSTLQMLNIMETFDVQKMGFQSVGAHSSLRRSEAARVRGSRAVLRRPGFREDADRVAQLEGLRARAREAHQAESHSHAGACGAGAESRRHDVLLHGGCAGDDGVDHPVELSRHGWRADAGRAGVHVSGSGRACSRSTDGHPNVYAPRKRPFQTIIPGSR